MTNVYLVSHMPKQPGMGRLAQHGTGMIGQKTIVAVGEAEAKATFEELMPTRAISSIVKVS